MVTHTHTQKRIHAHTHTQDDHYNPLRMLRLMGSIVIRMMVIDTVDLPYVIKLCFYEEIELEKYSNEF